MKWSATSSSAPCPAMTETSAKRPKHWDSAAARCIAGCKNTAWNETPHVRTSHPASGAGGGTARIVDRTDSPLVWRLFVADRLDADVSYYEFVAGLRTFLAAPRGLFPANFVKPPFRDEGRGFFFPGARRQQR